ncbi:MAG: 3-oxoacyl-(acyl-carrier-protein) reductase [Planctomycetota bacterium]|jgi:3-oxoacyl-[acyl-carrier protein] reductase
MSDPSRPLQGRRAVVTGASRGIGRAVAESLAMAGAHVICAATREGGCDETVAGIQAHGGSAEGMAVDVGDEASVQAFAARVLEGGAPNILVNNAGITRDGLFLRMSADDFDQVLHVNLRGAFLMTKAFARPMCKVDSARIVQIGSVIGLTGNAGQVNYAASKAGLIGLTKSLAKEFGGRGMTVNLVAPGFIATDMTAELPEKVRETIMGSIPLGRMGTGCDVAGAVAFLCSDSAAYMTGQVLVVDGGMTM